MTTKTGLICITTILSLVLSGCDKRPGNPDEPLASGPNGMISNGMTEAEVTAELGEPRKRRG